MPRDSICLARRRHNATLPSRLGKIYWPQRKRPTGTNEKDHPLYTPHRKVKNRAGRCFNDQAVVLQPFRGAEGLHHCTSLLGPWFPWCPWCSSLVQYSQASLECELIDGHHGSIRLVFGCSMMTEHFQLRHDFSFIFRIRAFVLRRGCSLHRLYSEIFALSILP